MANEWISVKDRLPELREKVFVGTVGEEFTASAARVRMAGNDPENWVWAVKDLNDWASRSSFTHWQPLPAPPESEHTDG